MLITLTTEELQDIIDSATEKIISRINQELRHKDHRSVCVPETPESGGLGFKLLRVYELEYWMKKQKVNVNIDNKGVTILLDLDSPERPDYPNSMDDDSLRIFNAITEYRCGKEG